MNDTLEPWGRPAENETTGVPWIVDVSPKVTRRRRVREFATGEVAGS